MGGRPEFIPAEVFRQYLSPTQLNRYFSVDNMYASSYVARCARINKPIKAKHRLLARYRPLDVVARARADACKIERTGNNKLLHDYTVYKDKIAELKVEIAELEDRKGRSTHTLSLDILSNRITSRDMLLEEEIIAGAQGYEFACGVYFLVHAGVVIYVGQSVNVYARVHAHRQEGRKPFDSFAFTPCEKEELDMLESLYIHAMCPSEQGRSTHGNLTAPYSMRQMIALGKRKKYTRNQQLLENVNE